MKTKKISLEERIELVKIYVNSYSRLLAIDLVNESVYSEFELKQIKDWMRYLKNTCEMHNLVFSTVLLI